MICRSNFGQMGPCRRHYFFDVVAVCDSLSRHLPDFPNCDSYVEIYYGMGVHTHRYYRTHMRSTLISWFCCFHQQHITQPQHTTTKMSGRRPPSGGLCPSVSMGRGGLPPTSSRRCSLTSVRRSRAVWGARMAPIKNERGGRRLDLDGRRSF